jgi:hypothetical protein
VNVSRPDLIGEMGDYLRETLRRCGLDCHCTSSQLMQHRTRDLLVRQRTQVINALQQRT